MLKHVQISPHKNRLDSVSLRSSISSCSSSVCESPEPIEIYRSPSRASSFSSLTEAPAQTTIKVFTSCLKVDIEYKTLGIQWDTTSKQIVFQILKRLKIKHRDPKLFCLSMEICVRKTDIKTILILDDEARPAILQACHPKGESRFSLQLKPGGLVRIHTSALQASSQYKSLVISQETTCDELLNILLSCYNSVEPVETFSLYEVCPGEEYQRKLHPDDIPLKCQLERLKKGETCHFLVRRNPNYQFVHIQPEPITRDKNKISNEDSKYFIVKDYHKQLQEKIENKTNFVHLNPLVEKLSEKKETFQTSLNHSSVSKKLNLSTESNNNTIENLIAKNKNIFSGFKYIKYRNEDDDSTKPNLLGKTKCMNCLNTETCLCKVTENKVPTDISTTCSTKEQYQDCRKKNTLIRPQKDFTNSYIPVYNIREIKTRNSSFSLFGRDKSFFDIDSGKHLIPLTFPDTSGSSEKFVEQTNNKTNTVCTKTLNQIKNNCNERANFPNIFQISSKYLNTSGLKLSNFNNKNSKEEEKPPQTFRNSFPLNEKVINNPPRGVGHFVYI